MAPHAAGGTRLALDLREVVLPGSLAALGAGTASAEGRVRDGGVDLTPAQATWRGLAITLGGRLAAGPPLAVRGTLTADLKEIAQALSLGALSGHATVSAALSGRGQTPAVEGQAEVTALVVQGHAVEPIEASFRLAASPGPDSQWEGTIESPRMYATTAPTMPATVTRTTASSPTLVRSETTVITGRSALRKA